MLNLEYIAELANSFPHALQVNLAPFALRQHTLAHWPSASLMGVVNLSPDSWYRESVSLSTEAAVRRGRRLFADGAAIVDVGAESTLPNAQLVKSENQIARLVPVIRELHASGGLVSVESYQPEVTRACLEAGAAIVNLTAASDTETFYRLAAAHDAGVVICYIQGADHVRSALEFTMHDDHTSVLYEYFARQTELASRCGVSKIWMDPGLGFYYKNLSDSAERVRYQMKTFLNAFRLRTLGWPVCQALPHAFEYFEEEVRTAESFFGVLALLARTDLLRTHEVAKLRGVLGAMNVFA